MLCVRCGKVMNLEDRRCPKCFASLTNQQISQMEVARHQLKEIADVERAGMTTRYARQGAGTGAMIGAIGLLISGSLLLIVASTLIGGAVGWFVGWRRWGQFRASFIYICAMMPFVLVASLNPFMLLAMLCTGMVLGVAIQLNQGR